MKEEGRNKFECLTKMVEMLEQIFTLVQRKKKGKWKARGKKSREEER